MNTLLCSYKGYDIHWCTIQKGGDIILIMAGTLFDEKMTLFSVVNNILIN